MEHTHAHPGPHPSGDDRGARIRDALEARFSPRLLRVEDDSASHAGHAGAQPGGQTHFSVLIVADVFAGMGRVARHRAVNDALTDEFARGLHALAVKTKAPDEP